MFIVFNVFSGKMRIMLRSEHAARLFCSMYQGTDYVNADEEFEYLLKNNESFQEVAQIGRTMLSDGELN